MVATAMAKASTSQGSHAVCEPCSLALKNPAKRSLPSRVTYGVVPISGFWTAPSVTIHSDPVRQVSGERGCG